MLYKKTCCRLEFREKCTFFMENEDLLCLVLSYVYSKQPIVGLTQEWLRELSFSRLKCGVRDRLHIYPLCGIFYFPWHRHQIEGTNGF